MGWGGGVRANPRLQLEGAEWGEVGQETEGMCLGGQSVPPAQRGRAGEAINDRSGVNVDILEECEGFHIFVSVLNVVAKQ